jgi:hypothetical protein
MAIDADYRTALEDLIKLQRQLRDDGVAAISGSSSRGLCLRTTRGFTSTTWLRS